MAVWIVTPVKVAGRTVAHGWSRFQRGQLTRLGKVRGSLHTTLRDLLDGQPGFPEAGDVISVVERTDEGQIRSTPYLIHPPRGLQA